MNITLSFKKHEIIHNVVWITKKHNLWFVLKMKRVPLKM